MPATPRLVPTDGEEGRLVAGASELGPGRRKVQLAGLLYCSSPGRVFKSRAGTEAEVEADGIYDQLL